MAKMQKKFSYTNQAAYLKNTAGKNDEVSDYVRIDVDHILTATLRWEELYVVSFQKSFP